MNSEWKGMLIFMGVILVVGVGLLFYFSEGKITGQVVFEDDYNSNVEVNLNKWNLPITYKIIEIPTGENSGYRCSDNEIKRIDNAFLKLEDLTNNALEFKKVEDLTLNTSITFSCLGRNFEDAFYEYKGFTYFNGYNNPAFIEFFNSNDPNRNCLDIEFHEILHAFGFEDIEDYSDSIMANKEVSRCLEIDKEIIDKLIEDYKK
jgi:hypothetical protein